MSHLLSPALGIRLMLIYFLVLHKCANPTPLYILRPHTFTLVRLSGANSLSVMSHIDIYLLIFMMTEQNHSTFTNS